MIRPRRGWRIGPGVTTGALLAAATVVTVSVGILALPLSERILGGASDQPALVNPQPGLASSQPGLASPQPGPASPSPETGQGHPAEGPAAPGSAPVGRPLDPDGYLVSRRELLERSALAQRGIEPYRSAANDLLDWAQGAGNDRPHASRILQIRGTTGAFVDDTARAYGLALAAIVSGRDDYAEAARATIMAWVTTNVELRNACPDSGACQTSLIVSRAAPGFVLAADLLPPSVLTATDRSDLDHWLRTVVLPSASLRDNNWGDAGTFARVVITDFLGDRGGFAQAIDRWRQLLDLVLSDGEIPAESARGDAAMSYTQEALDYKVAVALIAERRGIDLWDAVGARGGSLREIGDLLAGAWRDPASWPSDTGVEVPAPSDVWELLYARWPNAAYARIVDLARPFGWSGHSALRWGTLAAGAPIGAPATTP
jgi:hypothetical protein